MIQEFRVQNYKSILKLKIELGRLTVLIGENGSGKSNILEAVSLGSAAANDKLDNEFLVSRGIRVTEPQLMRSAFDKENISKDIIIDFIGDNENKSSCFELKNDNKAYSKWIKKHIPKHHTKEFMEAFDTSRTVAQYSEKFIENNENLESIILAFNQFIKENLQLDYLIALEGFLIYSPENFSLRIFEQEGQIEPLGVHGQGLFKLLKVLSLEENVPRLKIIKEKLRLIDWFQDFDIPSHLSETEKTIKINDKYLDRDLAYFDQKSSNEGFLFLLFYFALFVSDDTPEFFAVDNIDASLNPKLCRQLIKELAALAKKFDKQVILTTHNPAVLDGLDLDDPEQKLYVVHRNKLGHTKIKSVMKPKTIEGQEPVKLSEAFLRGYIGGLPKGF